MKKIDENLLQRLQKLSMLELSDEHKDAIMEDCNRFLEFVDILNEIDVNHLDASFSPIEASATLRKDIPQSDPTIGQEIVSNAPKSQENFFIVPKIIE